MIVIKHKKTHFRVSYIEYSCGVCKTALNHINRDSNYCPNCGESLKQRFPRTKYYDCLEKLCKEYRIKNSVTLRTLHDALIAKFNVSREYAEIIVRDWLE